MFNQLLSKLNYDPREDQLILLGDYVDRGTQSRDVIEQAIKLHEDGAVVLRGNHDQMFIDATNFNNEDLFIFNGGMDTVESYMEDTCYDYSYYLEGMRIIREDYKHHVDFLKFGTEFYYETDNHIFVHAGINPNANHWKYTEPDELLWIRDEFIHNPTRIEDKIVVFGHTPTINLHDSADIWFGGDKIGIDGGACFGGQMNCLEINDDSYVVHSIDRNGKYSRETWKIVVDKCNNK
jgi:serine/threonine protein phosphatase 1